MATQSCLAEMPQICFYLLVPTKNCFQNEFRALFPLHGQEAKTPPCTCPPQQLWGSGQQGGHCAVHGSSLRRPLQRALFTCPVWGGGGKHPDCILSAISCYSLGGVTLKLIFTLNKGFHQHEMTRAASPNTHWGCSPAPCWQDPSQVPVVQRLWTGGRSECRVRGWILFLPGQSWAGRGPALCLGHIQATSSRPSPTQAQAASGPDCETPQTIQKCAGNTQDFPSPS